MGDRHDRAGSGWGQVAGIHESGNEPLGSIKCGEFFLLISEQTATFDLYIIN
jgi:hypothetical protein